jgi:hypothetical protein
MRTKADLFQAGSDLLGEFCLRNALPPPALHRVEPGEWRFGGTCAFWRRSSIWICIEKTAHPGTAGRQWSWPGYAVDRTPYGVLAHELGHHVDWLRSTQRGAYYGDFSIGLRQRTREEKLTNYCPNDAEWFAEIFRLFVTNPDFLSRLRPKTYRALRDADLQPVVAATWKEVLADAPQRTLDAATRRIESSTQETLL